MLNVHIKPNKMKFEGLVGKKINDVFITCVRDMALILKEKHTGICTNKNGRRKKNSKEIKLNIHLKYSIYYKY